MQDYTRIILLQCLINWKQGTGPTHTQGKTYKYREVVTKVVLHMED